MSMPGREPYRYELDMEYRPIDIRPQLRGIAKSIAGIVFFNELRKASKRLAEPEDWTFEPIDDDLLEWLPTTVETPPTPPTDAGGIDQPQYLLYAKGLVKIEDTVADLLDAYLATCDRPDPSLLERVRSIQSLFAYLEGDSDPRSHLG